MSISRNVIDPLLPNSRIAKFRYHPITNWFEIDLHKSPISHVIYRFLRDMDSHPDEYFEEDPNLIALIGYILYYHHKTHPNDKIVSSLISKVKPYVAIQVYELLHSSSSSVKPNLNQTAIACEILVMFVDIANIIKYKSVFVHLFGQLNSCKALKTFMDKAKFEPGAYLTNFHKIKILNNKLIGMTLKDVKKGWEQATNINTQFARIDVLLDGIIENGELKEILISRFDLFKIKQHLKKLEDEFNATYWPLLSEIGRFINKKSMMTRKRNHSSYATNRYSTNTAYIHSKLTFGSLFSGKIGMIKEEQHDCIDISNLKETCNGILRDHEIFKHAAQARLNDPQLIETKSKVKQKVELISHSDLLDHLLSMVHGLKTLTTPYIEYNEDINDEHKKLMETNDSLEKEIDKMDKKKLLFKTDQVMFTRNY